MTAFDERIARAVDRMAADLARRGFVLDRRAPLYAAWSAAVRFYQEQGWPPP